MKIFNIGYKDIGNYKIWVCDKDPIPFTSFQCAAARNQKFLLETIAKLLKMLINICENFKWPLILKGAFPIKTLPLKPLCKLDAADVTFIPGKYPTRFLFIRMWIFIFCDF